MRTWQEVRDELLAADPELRRGYDRLGPLYGLISNVIGLRLDQGLTQKELAERMGKQQPSIARFEAGNTVPTLTFLQDIAEALGAKLVVCIEPGDAPSHAEATAEQDKTTEKSKPARPRRKQAVKT